MIFLKKLKFKITKFLYELICRTSRSYSHIRKSYDSPADTINSFFAKCLFLIVHEYLPHFKKPRTFSEKLFNRMLYSRDKIWAYVSDKFLVRQYVKQLVGEEILVPLLWVGSRPQDIPFNSLPQKFIIKMNHGCKYNIFIDKKNDLNYKDVINKLISWSKENYCLDHNAGLEWAYKNIKPKILIEEYLEEEDGKPPKDYKFFCFSGRVEFILITYDRFGYHREKHFTRDFSPLDLWNGTDQYPGPYSCPKNLGEMINIAETLSNDFDFMRVDLYNLKGKIYFGELTCYPAGGLAPFIPRKWDFIFGEKWELNKRHK